MAVKSMSRGLVWESGRNRKITSESVCAFHLAEGGAMGEPGEVVIFSVKGDSLDIAHGNYVYGRFNVDRFLDMLKGFEGIDFYFGNEGFLSIDGWGYFYTGFGNHLFMKKEIFDELSDKYKEMDCPERYCSYKTDIEAYFCRKNIRMV